MKPWWNKTIYYQLKQISLVPDKYGKHLKIKMVSAYTGDGKFIKHLKLDEDILDILSEGWIVYNKPVKNDIARKDNDG
tara:strand:- start:283 stop:516 length:234 start_codon:yes stop_codon:yes gene_type:complete